jgi:crotonobetainyl-CoA:carnitine CoA-transferase CaiB-like acyl-CoA transferase
VAGKAAAQLHILDFAGCSVAERFDEFDIVGHPGLPCGPVYNIQDAFADSQVEALRITRSVTHPRLGNVELIAQPCEITGFDRSIRTATPDIGEHNNEILRSPGYDAKAIEGLKAARAI